MTTNKIGGNPNFGGIRTIKQALGSQKTEFHPGVERTKIAALLCSNFILEDARIISDWDSEFGTTDFALLLVKLVNNGIPEDGHQYTCAAGGVNILKQVRELLSPYRRLPVAVSLQMKDSKNGRSYYFLDDPIVQSSGVTDNTVNNGHEPVDGAAVSAETVPF